MAAERAGGGTVVIGCSSSSSEAERWKICFSPLHRFEQNGFNGGSSKGSKKKKTVYGQHSFQTPSAAGYATGHAR